MKKTTEVRTCKCCGQAFLFKFRPCYAHTTRGTYCSLKCFGKAHTKLPDDIDAMLVQRFQNGDRWAQIARDLHCSARLIRLRAKQLGLQGYLGHRGVTNGMYGRTHTPETVEKLRQASQRQFSAPGARETQALLTIKQIQDGRTGKALNKLETRVARMFDAAGLSYQQQYALGRFVFDFYLPATHTLVEVHGTFWHADPRKYEPDALSPIQQRNVANDAKKAAHAMACGYALTVLWEADMP